LDCSPQTSAAVIVEDETGSAQLFTFAALEQDFVPPILQPRFSHAFRASCVSFAP
jgi:hypothetical protein